MKYQKYLLWGSFPVIPLTFSQVRGFHSRIMSFRIFFSHPAVIWGLEVCSGSARCNSKKLPWFVDVSPREAIYLASHRSCTPSVLSDFWISCLHQPEIALAKSRGCAGCNATWNLGVKSIVSTIRGKQLNAMVALLGTAMFTKSLWLDMIGC